MGFCFWVRFGDGEDFGVYSLFWTLLGRLVYRYLGVCCVDRLFFRIWVIYANYIFEVEVLFVRGFRVLVIAEVFGREV